MIENITVIIPYYNSANTIVKSVSSVLNQTIDIEIEIIIVDDGSVESPKQIIDKNFEEYLKKNGKRKIKIVRQKNLGPADARNTGIAEAKTEYIAFLDSDDYWHPSKLKKQCTQLENKKLNAIGCDWNNKSHFISIFNKNNTVYNLPKIFVALKWWPHISTIVIRKSLCQEFRGLDNKFKFADDGDFFLKIAKDYNLNVLKDSLVTCHAFKRYEFSDGVSSNLIGMNNDEVNTIKKHFQNFLIAKILIFWIKIKHYKRILKRYYFLNIHK